MELSGDFIFDAPQVFTWQALQDPDVLASAMPGGEDFKKIGENEYSGLLNIKVGPVQGKFAGTIKLSDIVPLEGYSIQVDGKGSPGFVKASGKLKLTDDEGKTHMTYEGSAQVGGRLASVGQRLMESSAKSIVRQSLEGLNEYLKAQVSANQATQSAGSSANQNTEASDTIPALGYRSPSQANVALNVFKDVISDLIPEQYRQVLVASFVLVLIMLIYRKLKK